MASCPITITRNPDTQRFEWIPWDNNEALVSNPRCLSLNASEVTSQWPILRYLLDDSDYAEQYRQNVHEFAANLFNATRMAPLYDARAALIIVPTQSVETIHL